MSDFCEDSTDMYTYVKILSKAWKKPALTIFCNGLPLDTTVSKCDGIHTGNQICNG